MPSRLRLNLRLIRELGAFHCVDPSSGSAAVYLRRDLATAEVDEFRLAPAELAEHVLAWRSAPAAVAGEVPAGPRSPLANMLFG